MADEPILTNGDTGDDPGMPRWVRVFVIVVIALVVVSALLHIAGRGLGGHAP